MIAFVTLARVLGWILMLLPLQFVLVTFNMPLATRLPMIFHRGVCRILRFRIERYGTMSRHKATLFVSNHSSYLDIDVLGAIVPGSFVAKAEVRDWPLFGTLARLQRTVFIDRRVSRTAYHCDEMAARLEAGSNLILFPEGTSNDGNRVLPFKSGFFGVAEKPINGAPLVVQPISIAYTRLNGIPMGRLYRPYFAWYGDMEMASHLWTVAGLGRATVVVQFHTPLTIAEHGSRKALAKACHEIIADGVSRALTGRLEGKPRVGLWAPISS